jgi:hypothetical protein
MVAAALTRSFLLPAGRWKLHERQALQKFKLMTLLLGDSTV